MFDRFINPQSRCSWFSNSNLQIILINLFRSCFLTIPNYPPRASTLEMSRKKINFRFTDALWFSKQTIGHSPTCTIHTKQRICSMKLSQLFRYQTKNVKVELSLKLCEQKNAGDLFVKARWGATLLVSTNWPRTRIVRQTVLGGRTLIERPRPRLMSNKGFDFEVPDFPMLLQPSLTQRLFATQFFLFLFFLFFSRWFVCGHCFLGILGSFIIFFRFFFSFESMAYLPIRLFAAKTHTHHKEYSRGHHLANRVGGFSSWLHDMCEAFCRPHILETLNVFGDFDSILQTGIQIDWFSSG